MFVGKAGDTEEDRQGTIERQTKTIEALVSEKEKISIELVRVMEELSRVSQLYADSKMVKEEAENRMKEAVTENQSMKISIKEKDERLQRMRDQVAFIQVAQIQQELRLVSSISRTHTHSNSCIRTRTFISNFNSFGDLTLIVQRRDCFTQSCSDESRK